MSTPIYNPQIPTPNTEIPDAQVQFLSNFGSLFNIFNTNHVSLDDPTNPGNHSVIQLVEQSQSRSTLSQEVAIYSKLVEGQTDQLFMRYQSNGKEFQLTEYQIYNIPFTIGDPQTTYFSILPGGLIIQFGQLFCAGKNEFNLQINPPVKVNISGLNLGGIGSMQVQPNVALQANSDGYFRNFILKSSLPMVNQFYLMIGNI